MSDRIAVMSAGRVQQVGTPQEIYDRPANRFVADFIGEANLIPGPLLGLGAHVTASVRPERLALDGPPRLRAQVLAATFLGADTLIEARAGEVPVRQARLRAVPWPWRRGIRSASAGPTTRNGCWPSKPMLNLRNTVLLLLPALAVILVFMGIPMLITLVYSFMTANTYGGVTWPLSLNAYVQMLFDQNFDGTYSFVASYVIIMARSLYLAAATTLLSLALGFPIAWYIFCQNQTRRTLLLTLVTLPFWINTLIRTYCWILLLRDQGLVNALLRDMHITSRPLTMLYNQGAVLLGLVYTFLPFMVLPIYATLERLDQRLIEASYDLYASRARMFQRIIWPLCRPGVAAGAVLVFAPALGAFLQPDMLGRRQAAADRQLDRDAVHRLAQLALRLGSGRAGHRGGIAGADGAGHAVAPRCARMSARRTAGTERGFNWRHAPGFGVFTAAMLAFLYMPMAVLVVYAFNANRLVTIWGGFSTKWFAEVVQNGDIQAAALISLIVATAATACSVTIAICAALGFERGRGFFGRAASTGLIMMPLVVPEIVVAITTLIFFSTIGLATGVLTLVIAHTVFCIPFALLPISSAAQGHGIGERGRRARPLRLGMAHLSTHHPAANDAGYRGRRHPRLCFLAG